VALQNRQLSRRRQHVLFEICVKIRAVTPSGFNCYVSTRKPACNTMYHTLNKETEINVSSKHGCQLNRKIQNGPHTVLVPLLITLHRLVKNKFNLKLSRDRRSGFDPWQGQIIFPSPPRLDWLLAHPASYPTDAGDLLPGVNRSGREANHSPPPRTDISSWLSALSAGIFYLHICGVASSARDNVSESFNVVILC
jgi:hypothetical protein